MFLDLIRRDGIKCVAISGKIISSATKKYPKSSLLMPKSSELYYFNFNSSTMPVDIDLEILKMPSFHAKLVLMKKHFLKVFF